jgi:hypothetical protein
MAHCGTTPGGGSPPDGAADEVATPPERRNTMRMSIRVGGRFVVALVCGLVAGEARGASVEVSPGDDIVTLTASLNAGDEIVFHGGVYPIETPLDWTGAGTSGQKITMRAVEGESAVIEMSNSWVVAYLHDASYFDIRGLTFQGEADYYVENGFSGLYIENVDGVTIENNKFTQIGGTALSLDGNNTNLKVNGNEITACRGTGIYVGCGDGSCWTEGSEIRGNWVHDLEGEWLYGIYLSPGSQDLFVSDNVVYGLPYRGIVLESTEYGEPNYVEGNAVWDVVDAGIAVSGASVVRNNVIFDIEGQGIATGVAGDRVYENVAITFNTVANTTEWAVEIRDWANRDGMVFSNNAIANPTGYGLLANEGMIDARNTLSSNVVTGLVSGLDPEGGAFQSGSGFADFEDAELRNFYPATSSSLTDAGDGASEGWVPLIDFNGLTRDGAFPDVGAYEYIGGSNPGWRISEGFKQLSDASVIADGELGGCCQENADGAEAGLWLSPLLGAWWRRRRRSRLTEPLRR